MLFGINTCTVSWYSAGAVNISSNISSIAGSVVLFNACSSVILNDPSISSSASIASGYHSTVCYETNSRIRVRTDKYCSGNY